MQTQAQGSMCFPKGKQKRGVYTAQENINSSCTTPGKLEQH